MKDMKPLPRALAVLLAAASLSAPAFSKDPAPPADPALQARVEEARAFLLGLIEPGVAFEFVPGADATESLQRLMRETLGTDDARELSRILGAGFLGAFDHYHLRLLVLEGLEGGIPVPYVESDVRMSRVTGVDGAEYYVLVDVAETEQGVRAQYAVVAPVAGGAIRVGGSREAWDRQEGGRPHFVAKLRQVLVEGEEPPIDPEPVAVPPPAEPAQPRAPAVVPFGDQI